MKQHLPLFDDVEDQRSIQPKTAQDDIAFKKERRRARKKPGRTPPAPETGPCCERCRNWNPPMRDDEEFGKCSVLAVATMPKLAYGIEKGTVHDWELLEKRGVPGEALRTGLSFSCFAYQQVKEEAA